MSIILYGILIAHLNAYREQYANIGITFAMTFVIKKLIKAGGNVDHADLIGVGGYALTIGEFVKLIGKMKVAGGIIAQSEESDKILGGFLGKALEMLQNVGK